MDEQIQIVFDFRKIKKPRIFWFENTRLFLFFKKIDSKLRIDVE
jgi:hypothetical protein